MNEIEWLDMIEEIKLHKGGVLVVEEKRNW